jgi:hypothetical protein
MVIQESGIGHGCRRQNATPANQAGLVVNRGLRHTPETIHPIGEHIMRRIHKPLCAGVLMVALLCLAPRGLFAAGTEDTATAEDVQHQMEALAEALGEVRKAGMTAPTADAANVQDLQALTEALTGVSGQMAGAMAGETTAEPDLETLLKTLQQQAARQQALQQQRQTTPATTP